MSTSEIIIRTNNTFKSKDLTKATFGLADCFNSANKAYKDACVILAKVEANKSYKDDGFSSLATMPTSRPRSAAAPVTVSP